MSWGGSNSKDDKPFSNRCNRCHASGRIVCEICSGRGQTIVGRDLKGYPKYATCSACMGLKTMRCRNCGGAGYT